MALRRPLAQVVVVRHGSTERNRGGVGLDAVRGHEDVPMTDEGRFEVGVTAGILADVRFERIYSSDLQRAMETAEIVADEQKEGVRVLGSPSIRRTVGYPEIVAVTALRSWDMGAAMEGKVTTPDVVEQIREWVRQDTVVPPGGESFRGFCSRVIGFVDGLFEQAKRERSLIAVVGHGRTAQVIDLWVAAGCDEECMHRDFAELLAEEPDFVPPGGAIRYKWDGLGWLGIVVPTGAASIGTQAAGGDYQSTKQDGVIVS